MPATATSQLSEPLLRRLECNLPHALASERHALKNSLCVALSEIMNGSLDPAARTPAGGIRVLGEHGALQSLHSALDTPCTGAAGALSTAERRLVRFVGHLRDIHQAGEDISIPNVALLVATHERGYTFQQLKAEIMRELGTLPPHEATPSSKREQNATFIAEYLLARCEEKRVVPTNARAFNFQLLAPEAGRHAGGVTAIFAAWDESTPLPRVTAAPLPGVDDATAQTDQPHLECAPGIMRWAMTIPVPDAASGPLLRS